MDERVFIAQLETADPEEFLRLLLRPTLEEEEALRAYLGDARYQRLHSMALKRNMSRAVPTADNTRIPGNVVVLPGIMGSSLDLVDRQGNACNVWLNARRITGGWFDLLRLNDSGRAAFNPDYEVRPAGILKRFYGEQLLSLSERWNVRAFSYDWRKDLEAAAAALESSLQGWFGPREPVHLVAHGMGGLVALTFINNYPDRWASMWDKQEGKRGGRLILIGVPCYGAPVMTQALTGQEHTIQWLTAADYRHNLQDMLAVTGSFASLYQMLPSPHISPENEKLYQATLYANRPVLQSHLTRARQHHEMLHNVLKAENAKRLFYIAGYNQPTYGEINLPAPDNKKPAAEEVPWWDMPDAYRLTLDGDGRVPHNYGIPHDSSGPSIPAYYVEETHGGLPVNSRVLEAITDLLETGSTQKLASTLPARRRTLDSEKDRQEAREQMQSEVGHARTQFERLTRRLNSNQQNSAPPRPASLDGVATPPSLRSVSVSPPASEAPAAGSLIGSEERKLEELLTRGFLSVSEDDQTALKPQNINVTPVTVEIGLLHGRIQEVHTLPLSTESIDGGSHKPAPIDAIAVGHYLGVLPQAAELALDIAISRFLPEGVPYQKVPDRDFPENARLLTQFSARGTLHGELAQNFFLPDPRPATGDKGAGDRLIAVVGMGVPGRFGEPELTVCARELCWSLRRMGRRHLATVLIGAGNGNIPFEAAVSAWLRGIRHAFAGTDDAVGPDADEAGTEVRQGPFRVTFVEFNAQRLADIQNAILYERDKLEKGGRMKIRFFGYGQDTLQTLKIKALEEERRKLDQRLDTLKQGSDAQTKREPKAPPSPTRMTVSLDRNVYRFGAITETASTPEREIPLDPKLVFNANDELAAEWQTDKQQERGEFLQRLLIPQDFREQLASPAPLVLLLDSTTARVHWEMMAIQDVFASSKAQNPDTVSDAVANFLGLCRGLTRTLRTTFAPPPEPPPPTRRVLRVLVVADPAADAHLPGAEEEGIAVAELFESYNEIYGERTGNHVQVVKLFGPREATRTSVLRHLMVHSYDMMHFAGHCIYEPTDPSRSGWIFTGGERITANELRRIDRIPKFVFSNACESGITPDRAELRSDGLAPSFAEAFFARGVSNFVCTAWPVDDLAARLFALALYRELLGLPDTAGAAATPATPEQAPPPVLAPRYMYEAMHTARMEIFGTPNGARTWGAYQHYGNPYLRLFVRPDEKPLDEKVVEEKEVITKPAKASSKPDPTASDKLPLDDAHAVVTETVPVPASDTKSSKS